MNTLKFGNGEWYGKKDTILAYNDLNSNFKPLPFSFDRASSATVVNKAGLIETVGSGEPRIDYKDDSKGALKLEPSRVNYVNNSNNASIWSSITSGGTITRASNYAISPDGTQNATRLQASVSGSGYALITLAITSAFDGNYTSTVYVKSNTNSNQEIAFYGRNSTNNAHTVGSEWTRIEFQGSSASGQSNYAYLGVSTSVTNEDNPIDILVWGGQVEQGSYATSYIPTSGSVVTRNQDACNNGGNEQVINSTEGVLYAEIKGFENDNVNRYISLCDGSSLNSIRIFYYNDGETVFFRKVVNNVSAIVSTTTAINQSELTKIAIRYDSTSFDIFSNGVKIITNSNSDTFANNTLNTINFTDSNGTTSPFLGNTKDVRVYNTALTDQELINLTTI